MKRILSFVPLIILILIFRFWFIHWDIIGGDWPYISKIMTKEFPILAPLWTSQNGLGGIATDFPIFSYQYFTIGFFVQVLHIYWEIVYKIFWFGMFLFLSIYSSYFFYKSVRKNPNTWEISLAIFLYIANSYILMIVGGGQLGIALSYAIAPLVLANIITFKDRIKEFSGFINQIQRAILLGFVLSIQIIFDPRLCYLTMGIGFLYIVFHHFFIQKVSIFSVVRYFVISLVTVILLHAYWIFPFIHFKLLSIASGITSTAGFAFFSFADFSHAFAFLHPNWPENIFGKVYFLQPEFLIYPFFAFLGLVLKNRQNSNDSYAKYIFFGLIGIIGIFLAKGVNEPFGQINLWLFNKLPGFNLFRDPTKYYLLIAIAYSFMIPYSVAQVSEVLRVKKAWKDVLILFCMILLILPVRNAITGNITGTFASSSIPQEYNQLEIFLSTQNNFFRTLWLPEQSRFRYQSEQHPLLTSDSVLNTNTIPSIVKILNKPNEESLLKDYSIKYIIIPDDTRKEIFFTNRRYDETKRRQLIRDIDKITWLKKIYIGKITVYELSGFRDHFWTNDNTTLTYTKNNISDYIINVNSSSAQTLYFSESYHPGWVMQYGQNKIISSKSTEGLNKFLLPRGSYSVHVFFFPETYEDYFYFFSGVSFICLLIFVFVSKYQKIPKNNGIS